MVKLIIYDDTIRGRKLSKPWIKKLDDIRRVGDAVTDEELSAARQSVQPDDPLRLFTTSVSLRSGSIGHVNFKICFTLNHLQEPNIKYMAHINCLNRYVWCEVIFS